MQIREDNIVHQRIHIFSLKKQRWSFLPILGIDPEDKTKDNFLTYVAFNQSSID